MLLFLDDNEAVNHYHKLLLKKLKFNGKVNFSSSVSALKKIISVENTIPQIALVVLDYNLPDGDAMDIVPLLYEKETFAGKVILLSSTVLPDEAAQALKNYPKVTIAEKPLKKEILEASIAG